MTETLTPFRRLGFGRVGILDQSLEAQFEQLAAAGCALEYASALV